MKFFAILWFLIKRGGGDFFFVFELLQTEKYQLEWDKKSLPDKNGIESRFNENYTRKKRVQIKNLEFFTYPMKDTRRKDINVKWERNFW